jgi:two-component system, OmpR family, KDP operon response regulator KdpE
LRRAPLRWRIGERSVERASRRPEIEGCRRPDPSGPVDRHVRLAACRVGLRALGHEVRTAATGDGGLSDAAVHPPAVVVLDLGLPDMDGMQVFNQLRGWTQTPVIIPSADGSEDRKVEALNGGADDYVTKPFGMRELDARLRVALRHYVTDQAEPITQLDAGPLTLDLVHCEASYRGERIDLTPKEFDFLAYLAVTSGRSANGE